MLWPSKKVTVETSSSDAHKCGKISCSARATLLITFLDSNGQGMSPYAYCEMHLIEDFPDNEVYELVDKSSSEPLSPGNWRI
jgi:hypothetical protein